MRESKSVLCAHAPWHRVERAPDPDGIHMQLLTALKPEQGWPRLWAWVPVRWRGGERFERLTSAPPHTESFHAEPGSSPGEPLRHALALRHFPAGPDTGLLCLFIYLDPRADAEEGGNGAALADLRVEDLNLAIDELLLRQPALPDWAHAFVPSPSSETEGGALSLLLAACQYPPGMLDVSRGAERDPALASPADAAMARLVAFCRQHPDGRKVSLLLIAGDEIYADASGGLADPSTSAERYARPYQHFKAGLARYLPPTLARIVHAPDDHEVQDNCEPCLLPDGSHDPGEYTASARAAAWQYRWEPDGQRERQGSAERFWHSFDWRGAAFFIADSRLEREPRTVARVAEAQMIGLAQRQAFSAWLTASAGRPRFVLSGALLLPRRRSSAAHVSGSLRSDAWCGFPASQQWLLAELWRQRASGVVFLSGDEHRSGHVSAEIRRADGQGPSLRLHSIHSSALYAPWPFAITDPEEFAAPEVFGIDAATGAVPQQLPSAELLCCEVGEWQDHPGDGFAWLRVSEGGTRLELRYDKAGAGALHAVTPMRGADAVLELG
ncbi:alkaline phosphatase D family protein [Paucibacter sediminis]|uniref:Alkaline phosphatase D family protein n=1 Tax=Paucibacter sediminis TaxID=3019553 RepID=A0AA95NM60_9BURK|nr:alkaline phosphatase D family protein [Paucibacter sp. S2-9]WIT13861.1 alkaline phosphatase D family protein [Paucibacter sp. S2-9]